VGLLLAGAELQNLFWSTARVENLSGRPLERVAVLVDDAVRELGALPPGHARFVVLPRRGDATFRLRFTAGGGEFLQCGESVDGGMYHVRVTVQPSLLADCRAELGPLRRSMVKEMLR
jgi:hypothetical protein